MTTQYTPLAVHTGNVAGGANLEFPKYMGGGGSVYNVLHFQNSRGQELT